MIDLAKTRSDPAGAAWLSLREASRQLGVSPATLRSWADGGRVPSYRTPGGHRRFRVDAGATPFAGARQALPSRWRLLEHSALGRVRVAMELHAPELEALALPPRARSEHRRLGRELCRLLTMAVQPEGGGLEARAEVLGAQYAALLRRYAVEPRAALRALFFFRNAVVASVIEFAFALDQASPEQLTLWLERVNAMLDCVNAALWHDFAQASPAHAR